MKTLRIAVTATEPFLLKAGKKLAKRLFCTYLTSQNRENLDFLLTLTKKGLYIEDCSPDNLGQLNIDFLRGKVAYRLRSLHHQKQLLAKAVGIKPSLKPTILDVTAGFGVDSFILAQLGCPVILLERSPIVAELLQDGLKRALIHPNHSSLTIKLIQIDAINYLTHITNGEKPSVIYLDPMYPQQLPRSALVKKELRFLRKLVGNDSDANRLLRLALNCAQRVVVKRPGLSPYLDGIIPHHSIGKQHRLDVYYPIS